MRHQSKKHTSEAQSSTNGFSLIELIIAVAVLAIALTGLVSTLYRSVQLDNSYENRSVALQGARSMMSQIKAQPRNLSGQHIKDFINNNTTTNRRFDVDGLEADNTTEGKVDFTDNGGHIRVDITVEWEDQMGQQEVGISSNFYIYD